MKKLLLFLIVFISLLNNSLAYHGLIKLNPSECIKCNLPIYILKNSNSFLEIKIFYHSNYEKELHTKHKEIFTIFKYFKSDSLYNILNSSLESEFYILEDLTKKVVFRCLFSEIINFRDSINTFIDFKLINKFSYKIQNDSLVNSDTKFHLINKSNLILISQNGGKVIDLTIENGYMNVLHNFLTETGISIENPQELSKNLLFSYNKKKSLFDSSMKKIPESFRPPFFSIINSFLIKDTIFIFLSTKQIIKKRNNTSYLVDGTPFLLKIWNNSQILIPIEMNSELFIMDIFEIANKFFMKNESRRIDFLRRTDLFELKYFGTKYKVYKTKQIKTPYKFHFKSFIHNIDLFEYSNTKSTINMIFTGGYIDSSFNYFQYKENPNQDIKAFYNSYREANPKKLNAIFGVFKSGNFLVLNSIKGDSSFLKIEYLNNHISNFYIGTLDSIRLIDIKFDLADNIVSAYFYNNSKKSIEVNTYQINTKSF